MTLINQDIKNLVSGISQQPPLLRHPEQLEEQFNGFSSEAAGLQKRPPTLNVAKLISSLNLKRKPLVHFINRDDTEKYIMIFTGDDVLVFDLEGNQKTVEFEGSAKDYIITGNPRRNLRCQTIADYTFIANRMVKTRMSDETTGDKWDTQGALINIKSGQYGRTYKVNINGSTVASFTTPDGSDKSHTTQIATDYIVSQLATQVSAKGYGIQQGSSWLYLYKSSTGSVTNTIQHVTVNSVAEQVDRFRGIKALYREVNGTNIAVSGTTITVYAHNLKGLGVVIENNNQNLKNEIEGCRNRWWKVTERIVEDTENYTDIDYILEWGTISEEVTVTSNVNAIETVDVYDGYNNQAAFGILKSVQKFSMLPASAPDGFIVKVAGEAGSTTDDYYIRYDDTEKIWKECARPGILSGYELTSMPHILVRNSDGTFTMKKAEWSKREIGDDDSNPQPSFIDQHINDIFFYRNRLGVIAGENVILTRSADFFNFWMTSALEVQDTDPIDLAVSDNKIATLLHAVPYDETLVLFSDDAQFILRCDGVLNPKDANIPPPVTRFGNSVKAKPACAGRNLYFPAERSEYTTVREFFTAADNTDRKDAQDITSHIPNYIPNGVYKLIPSTVENLILFLTEGAENKVYIYKYLFVDSVRQQAAWSVWDFQNKVYGAEFIDSYLYIVVERNGVLCLEKMSFSFNTTDFEDEPYRVFLDRKLVYDVPKGSYSDLNDETTLNLADIYGETYQEDHQYSVVTTDGTYVLSEGNIVKLIGNYEEQSIIVGLNYLFRAVMSTLMLKKTDEGRTQAITEGRLQIKYFWVNYSESGYFKIIVEHFDKNTYTYENTARILGTSSNILNKLPFHTGQFKVPIHSLNTNCRIYIESEEPNPLAFVGAGWIGDYYRRTRQY